MRQSCIASAGRFGVALLRCVCRVYWLVEMYRWSKHDDAFDAAMEHAVTMSHVVKILGALVVFVVALVFVEHVVEPFVRWGAAAPRGSALRKKVFAAMLAHVLWHGAFVVLLLCAIPPRHRMGPLCFYGVGSCLISWGLKLWVKAAMTGESVGSNSERPQTSSGPRPDGVRDA